jgi:hypothetical protein
MLKNNCIIYYNSKKMKVLKIKNTIKLLELIVETFKKLLNLIDNFQETIVKLIENDFSINIDDNIKLTKIILENNVKLLYDNILILFNIQYKNNQIINISINDIIPYGYCINYNNSDIYINSFKIKYSDESIIKIVEYDNLLEPIGVYFLGTHINNINDVETTTKILSKCFNNNLKTIGCIKTVCLKYIQIVNNLQKIFI